MPDPALLGAGRIRILDPALVSGHAVLSKARIVVAMSEPIALIEEALADGCGRADMPAGNALAEISLSGILDAFGREIEPTWHG